MDGSIDHFFLLSIRESATHTIHFLFLEYLHNKNDKYWFGINRKSIGKEELLEQLESPLVL